MAWGGMGWGGVVRVMSGVIDILSLFITKVAGIIHACYVCKTVSCSLSIDCAWQ